MGRCMWWGCGIELHYYTCDKSRQEYRRFGIEEFNNDSDITSLVETWEHDSQRNQGLGNYNVHSLIGRKIWVNEEDKEGGMFD